jgi:nucleotide-binding universal stress UspA family protein
VFKHILVAYDGSTSSRKALDVAIGLAKMLRSNLSLVSVEEHLPSYPGDVGEVKEEKERQNEVFQKLQNEAREIARLNGLDLNRADVLIGHVAKSIINHSKSIQCDLIVMGHSGRSGAWGTFLGSTAEKVSRNAHCTVMIVR